MTDQPMSREDKYRAAQQRQRETPEEYAARIKQERPPPAVRVPAKSLAMVADFYYRSWLVDLREYPELKITLADLFRPEFWSPFGNPQSNKFKPLDLVRCIAADRSWDLHLTVDSIVGFGAMMRPFGIALPGSPLAIMLEQMMGATGPAAMQQADADAEIAGLAGVRP